MWGKLVNHVMNFLLRIIKFFKGILNLPSISNNPQTPSPPALRDDLDTEYSAQTLTPAEGQSNIERPQHHPPPNDADSNILWTQWSLIGVCAAAIGICVQALQTSGVLHSMSFHWICMATVCSLTAVLVCIYTPGDYKRVSLLVVHVGIFIVFTALMVALVINIQLTFKVVSIAVYLIGILFIVCANLCKRKP